MTNMEIKKAWEQMKRNIKKELGKDYNGFNYGFTMNARQIENRTATFTISIAWSYERLMKYEQDRIDRVMADPDWSEEGRARIIEDAKENMKSIEDRRARFGTKENEVQWATKTFENSKAFEKFQNTVGKTTWELETRDGFYGMRFYY